MGKQAYILPYGERRRLHNRAYRAQQRNHSEVCGVLVIDSDKRIELRFLRNRSDQPYKYRLSRMDIRTVRNSIAGQNRRILGTFHSHPVGEAVPGPGDLAEGFFNGTELIYDVCALEARLWRRRNHGGRRIAKELPLVLDPRAKRAV